jgi:hypothetical protein
MPKYRRNRVPGGTFFFTANLRERRSDVLVRHVDGSIQFATIGILLPTWITLISTR